MTNRTLASRRQTDPSFPSTTKALCCLLVCALRVTSGCLTVTSFDELSSAVDAADASLTLCPFDIAKPTEATLQLTNRNLTLSCERVIDADKCLLSGPGEIVRIKGGKSEVVVDGFTFQGATRAAVRIVRSAAPNTQTFQDCDFSENGGQRGGALRADPGTSVVLSSCSFTGNRAFQGGAIYHTGGRMSITGSSFVSNVAGVSDRVQAVYVIKAESPVSQYRVYSTFLPVILQRGGAIKSDTSATLELKNVVFTNNRAKKAPGGVVAVADESTLIANVGVSGDSNSPCNGVYVEATNSCLPFFNAGSGGGGGGGGDDSDEFVPGKLTQRNKGLRLSQGMKVKIIARTGQNVRFTSGARVRDESTIPFHDEPDGAAVFELDSGHYVYISNAELVNAEGGVYGLEFDSNGRTVNYVNRLNGTTRNCDGGATPWNTWVSCEEFSTGQCWQVDPTGNREPETTKLVEETGGRFEAMTFDARNPNSVQFFVTEDTQGGALRRFRPDNGTELDWDMLRSNGTLDYLEILPNLEFRWTDSLAVGRLSASTHFPYSEGIAHDNGILSVISKVNKEVIRLNFDSGSYTVDSTISNPPGGGSFDSTPDQLRHFNDVLYFTEDGGDTPGVYVYDGSSYYTLFETYFPKFYKDETTGVAFSPDGSKLYACLQRIGYLLQFERKDGLPFEGSRRLVGKKYPLDRSLLRTRY